MSAHQVVLAVADTTSLNHTSHPATTGLGPLHKKTSSARGLHLHSVLALSEQGEPLGILHAHWWARTQVRSRAERKRDINRRAPQDKESHRWLAGYQELVKQSLQHQQDRPSEEQTTCPRLIMVADREADIYELFLAAQAEASQAACGVLVRALHPRRMEEEVLHKTLKSGCRTEERQLGTLERLERMLMVDLIVAWRLLAITHAARAQPEASACEWFSQEEWRVLSCWATRKAAALSATNIKQVVGWLARLGGFLGRKNDGEPGVQSLWLGLQRLQPMMELWMAQQSVGNG